MNVTCECDTDRTASMSICKYLPLFRAASKWRHVMQSSSLVRFLMKCHSACSQFCVLQSNVCMHSIAVMLHLVQEKCAKQET